MQNELEGLYNMLVSQTDIMKNVDELVEKQIEHELMQFKELATWSDYVLSGEYTGDYSSIDREIMKEIQSLSDKEKERVLRVVRALK